MLFGQVQEMRKKVGINSLRFKTPRTLLVKWGGENVCLPTLDNFFFLLWRQASAKVVRGTEVVAL